MNILFLTLLDFDSLAERNIYTDLLRKFYQEGHGVYVISPVERKKHAKTRLLRTDCRLAILKLRIGNIQKTNVIEKGITTVLLESAFISAIKRFYGDVVFDLVLYSTPPITFQRAVSYVKQRDSATTYLMLKDIFPQNAVDIGMLAKHGVKGLLYRYFRKKEKKLYQESDYIGCMSEANVAYVRKHNPEIVPDKVEVCPNCIEPIFRTFSDKEKKSIRKKLGLPENKLLFIYGGNLGKPQGIPFLVQCLRSAASNSDVYFLIVGTGTEYDILERFSLSEKPKNIKIMKALPKDEYEEMTYAADVGLIFLDYRFTIPNFPSRMLTYMQAGIPVLAVTDENTDIGKVITEGGFGWWCKSNQVQGFIKIMKTVLSADLSALGKNAFVYMMEHYTVEQVYQIISNRVIRQNVQEDK